MRCGYMSFKMPRVLVLVCLISSGYGDNLFDYELYQDVLDPELCDRQLEAMGRFEFYDASFRVPQGVLGGNFISLGNYHQCLAIQQEFQGGNIEGKYCLIQTEVTPPTMRLPALGTVSASENVTWTELKLDLLVNKRKRDGLYTEIELVTGRRAVELDSVMPQSLSLYLAVCIPKACTVDSALAPYTENAPVGFNYTERYCRLPDDKPFVGADYTIMIIFSLIGVLTIISTAYELRHIFILRKDPKEARELFTACSVYSNTGNLLTFAEKPRALDCIDGIRSLSILWIVFGHTFSVYLTHVANYFETLEWSYKRRALWIMSANIGVDSFLTLSGLLLVYTNIRKMTQKSLLKTLHMFYLNRILRIFPLLAAAVLIQSSVLHRVSDGPNWHSMGEEVQSCRRYWWSALLHVQNIVISRCLSHTWYLSVDMQLHIISPLVLFWVLGSRRAAWSSLTLAILASMAATFAFCFIYNFIPSPNAATATGAGIREYILYYYHNTVTRSPPFFIGMMCGYVLHITREKTIKLPKWSIVVCYTLAVALSFYALYVVHPSLQADWDNQTVDNLNHSLRRACWSLALCWLIFACVHGCGGPVNWLLSLKQWKVVARISYAMYLFHPLVQHVTAGAAVAPIYFSMETMFMLFASDLVYTVVLSVAACVLIDAPMATLQKILLGGAPKPQEVKNEDRNRSEPVAEAEKGDRVEK